jgi:hypothetical protein
MFIFVIFLHEYLRNNDFLLDTNAHDVWANNELSGTICL